jgi:hypothetical protein
MNLKSLTVIAGIAVGAAGEARASIGSVERRHEYDGMTTEDLEASTRRFIRKNSGGISSSTSGVMKGRAKRALRTHTTAMTRGGKSGKMYDDDMITSMGGKSNKGSGAVLNEEVSATGIEKETISL